MAQARRLLLSSALAAVGLALFSPSLAAAANCSPNLAEELSSTGTASQLLTVVAAAPSSTVGSFTLWQRRGGCWLPSAGPWRAWLGFNGVSTNHLEGDGTTPEGAYGIGAEMFGVAPDPGVAYGYHRLVCGDWWDEDPSTAGYNRFVHVPCGQQPDFGGGSEALWLSPTAYAYFALIDYNTRPVVPGRGSAIFLHVASGTPTDGCVALPRAELVRVLRWLSPRLAPLIVIGTATEIRRF